MFAVRLHREETAFLPTYSQFRTMKVPSPLSNLNLKVLSGSAHVEQVPQVIGQAAEIPAKVQRFLVSLVATHEQYLDIFVPSSLVIFNLKAESAQDSVGAAVDGAAEGDGVGATGAAVGPNGVAEGLGDGFIDVVGLLEGLSLGTLLGSKLGMLLGFELG